MGVAHMLGLDGTVPVLTAFGPRTPLLRPDQLLLFADDNSNAFERRIIDERGIEEVRLARVAADPLGAARGVVEGWAPRFRRFLIHVDVDVLDYVDFPIAENTRRHEGLTFSQLVAALGELVAAPNWVALTICEVNPHHAELDGSTLRRFSEAVADILSGAPRLRS
jgi:arginase